MATLSERLSESLATIDQSKHDEAERKRQREEQLKELEARESAKQSQEIVRALERDLNDESLLDLISAHSKFVTDRHSQTIQISFYNPETDFTSSTVSKVFDKAILFAVENQDSKLRRAPIRTLSSFSYLRKAKELHNAIRSDAVARKLAELEKNGVEIKFIQHGSSKWDPFGGEYIVHISYRRGNNSPAQG